jgi:hypothetical protein
MMLLHLVVPVLGILLFLPAEVVALGINFAGLGIAALTYPANDAPWIILGWMAVGLLVYFLATNPQRLGETAALYLQDLTAAAE